MTTYKMSDTEVYTNKTGWTFITLVQKILSSSSASLELSTGVRHGDDIEHIIVSAWEWVMFSVPEYS